MEGAAWRAPARLRHLARDRRQATACGPLSEPRNGREQGTGVGVRRRGEEPARWSRLDDLAGVEDIDPVASLGDQRQVVTDEEYGEPELGAQRDDRIQDTAPEE